VYYIYVRLCVHIGILYLFFKAKFISLCWYNCQIVCVTSKWFYFNREKPLALYAFTNEKSVKEKLTTHTSSGAISFNDVMVHFSGKNLSITFVNNSKHHAVKMLTKNV